MATVGLSKPYIAKYSNTNGTTTYSGGMVMGKAISYNLEVEAADDNNLYADNGIAESDTRFSNGTITVGTDSLEDSVTSLMLGVTAGEDGELTFDDDMVAPDLGFGIIIAGKKNGVYQYRAVILTKIKFGIPSEEAETMGDTIEWQTPEAEATVMRDDTEKHAWKKTKVFATEALADAYIKTFLNITASPSA